MFKRIFCVLALCIVALLGASFDTRPVTQRAHAATLHIAQRTDYGTGYCSGTAIGPHAVLTATHCELPTDQLAIQELHDVTQILGRLRDDHDHTIYLVSAEFKDYASVNESDALEQTEPVFLFGNPGDWHDIYRKGYVAGVLDEDEVLFELPVFHGDSGSGVFDEAGQLVAVISGQEYQQKNPQDFIRMTFVFRLHFTDAQLSQARSFKPWTTSFSRRSKATTTVSTT